jgi:hypothetical protein
MRIARCALHARAYRAARIAHARVCTSAAAFKLVKKYNKATGAAPGTRLSALPLLLASPLFHSRPLQLLFQRAAKWRHEGSQHGSGAVAAQAAMQERASASGTPAFSAFGGGSFDRAGGIAAAFGATGTASPVKAALPLSPLRLRAGVPILAAAAAAGAAAESSREAHLLSSGSDAGGACENALFEGGGGSPAPAVRCEGCVRRQTRFVVLGCSHSFCWGCVAASLVRQRRTLQRQSSRGSGLDLSASQPAAAAAAPAPAPQPLPPNAGGLARRLATPAEPWASSSNALGQPGASAFSGDAFEQTLFECPVCDALHDLDKGHLEVNALLADASYVWMLAPADGERRNRRILSRSRLAGMDFASLSVYGSVGSPGHMGGGVLHGEGVGPFSASVGAGVGPGGGGWPKMARVPSWSSLTLARPA